MNFLTAYLVQFFFSFLLLLFQDLSSPTRDWNQALTMKAWSPHHRPIREFLVFVFNSLLIMHKRMTIFSFVWRLTGPQNSVYLCSLFQFLTQKYLFGVIFFCKSVTSNCLISHNITGIFIQRSIKWNLILDFSRLQIWA